MFDENYIAFKMKYLRLHLTSPVRFDCRLSRLSRRLLETDSKSLRSMNGSRRNSGSSLVSSSSASSNLSHLEEDSWILWGRIVNEWEDVRKKKEKQLKVRLGGGKTHGAFIFYSSFWS